MTDTATLESLEPEAHAPAGAQGTVPIDSIRVLPEQARDHGDLAELAHSIKIHGVLAPVLVRQTAEGYLLVAGGRRLAAARMAGLTEVPVHAKSVGDGSGTSVLRLVENVQRRSLHPVEEATALAALRAEHGLSVQEIARQTGRSALHVSKRLSLLNLHPLVQGAIGPGDLGIGEAEDIARLPDRDEQLLAMREVREGNDSEKVVQRRLAAHERSMSRESIRDGLLAVGEVEFAGVLGRDGFPVSSDPQPGYLYWPEGRGSSQGDKFEFQVSDTGTVTWVATNPDPYLGDEDPEVVASASALVQRREIAIGQAGTMERPLEPATKDDATREREKAERARSKQLRRRDEEREAHLNKLVRRGVAYPKVGEFTLRALIEAAPAAVREIAYTRCRVPKGEREQGFGEEWKLDDYLAETKGDGLLRLAYAVALQLREEVMDRAVKYKWTDIAESDGRDQVAGYLDHLGGTGYPGSAEEFALIGEQEPDEIETPEPDED
jgi:ParB/RepB/Spo0J family partition protein